MKEATTPPHWVGWLLDKYCHPDLLESIEGDLYEVFVEDVREHGIKKARRKYILNVVAFLRHRRLRKKNHSSTENHMDLITNYLKISLRDIRRHRVFSAINLFGLITGYSALLLILQFVLFETGYDRFHAKASQIYRVINERYQNGEMVQKGAITYPTVGPTLVKEYPEVEAYTRLIPGGREYLNFHNEMFMMENYLWADEHFLKFFSFPLLAGEKTALGEPAQLIMTESFAKRFVPEGQDVAGLVGETIRVNDWDFPCTVTGILRDLPANSHLQFDVAISYRTFIKMAGEGADNSWRWSDFYHYIRLDEQSNPESFQARLDQFSEQYFKNGEVSGAVEKFYLEPLTEIHLDNSLEYEYAKVIDGGFIRLILVIALIIMVIAWINYVNLTTSRALQRAREVGIRKALGAYRAQLIGQFLTESMLLNLFALVFSCLIILACQPYFNKLTGLPLDLTVLFSARVSGIPFPVIFFSGFILMVLMVGLYPAFLLSGFRTEDVLKGKYGLVGDMVNLRRILVITQFAAALILISGSVAVYRQIRFMQSQDLGMNIENTLVLYGPNLTNFDSLYILNFNQFKHELMSHPGIRSVTSTGRMFGEKMPRAFRIWSSADPDQNDLTSSWLPVDHDFMEQFEIDLVAGRNFDYSDHNFRGELVNTMMINEAAVDLLMFEDAEDAVGKKVEMWGGEGQFEIIGVVSNFHQRSLRQAIEPIIFLPFSDNDHFMAVKYENGQEEQVIAKAEELYRQFYPGNYFDYFFLPDYFNRQYQDDERVGTVSSLFTVLAIVLAVLGLYGLVLITLMKRTKEIGIRKVLGATLAGLLGLFGKQFLILISCSILVGLPVSYFIIQAFLRDYAYSTGVEIWVLVVSAICLLAVCALTILLQTRRISANNPVESLRYE